MQEPKGQTNIGVRPYLRRVTMPLCTADLVPREVAERWLKYLREELPTVAFRCSTQRQAANLTQRTVPLGKGAAAKKAAAAAKAGEREGGRGGRSALSGSACLGAETLLQLLKNYARNLDIKTAITVGEALRNDIAVSSAMHTSRLARSVVDLSCSAP